MSNKFEQIAQERPGYLTVLASFKNEHGEKFVIYRMGSLPAYFVTGDELDWEVGYRFDEACATLVYDFLLSQSEMQSMIDLIKDIKRKERIDKIMVIMPDLSLREQKILNMRFGLKDGITHTLEEVAKEFGVTRERIRQIENKVLEKINHVD